MVFFFVSGISSDWRWCAPKGMIYYIQIDAVTGYESIYKLILGRKECVKAPTAQFLVFSRPETPPEPRPVVRSMELSSWLPWVACWLLLGAGHLVVIHLLCLTLPLRRQRVVGSLECGRSLGKRMRPIGSKLTDQVHLLIFAPTTSPICQPSLHQPRCPLTRFSGQNTWSPGSCYRSWDSTMTTGIRSIRASHGSGSVSVTCCCWRSYYPLRRLRLGER